MVNPMIKMIDWNTIAEVIWACGITGVTTALAIMNKTVGGYICAGIIFISFAVQCVTKKKSPEERQAQIDAVKQL